MRFKTSHLYLLQHKTFIRIIFHVVDVVSLFFTNSGMHLNRLGAHTTDASSANVIITEVYGNGLMDVRQFVTF